MTYYYKAFSPARPAARLLEELAHRAALERRCWRDPALAEAMAWAALATGAVLVTHKAPRAKDPLTEEQQ